MYQKFRYSGFIKGATVFCLLVFLGLAYFLVAEQGGLEGMLGGLAVIIVGVIWPYLRSPKAVSWDEAGVVLYQQSGQKVFSATDYEIDIESGVQLFWGMRLWASGGYFGFWGLFSSPRLGRYWLYQTDTSSKHYLRLQHRTSKKLYFIAL
ncbi:MAG: hypothetical protein Q4A61_05790 [Porphyromonadaceae bacterium]|nr:hypothetical protein [Porphyromonadaceae bacterium]